MSLPIMVIGVIGIVVVILALGAAVSVFHTQRVVRFEQACRDRGWLVEHKGGPGDKRQISGSTGGTGWKYEFPLSSPNPDDSDDFTEAQAAWLHVDCLSLPADIVLLMPRKTRAGQLGSAIQAMSWFGEIGHRLIELLVVQSLHGDRPDVELFMGLQPVQSGSDALREQFSVLATSENAAAKILGRRETALLQFAADPALRVAQRSATILLWSRGLVLPIERQITDVTQLEELVTLTIRLGGSFNGR